ncbi:MAG: hypothetical protein KIT87_16210 [Anaerolineae bacterium]|nr:hypothetical protein [Anaerolineae bacterium]
MITVTIPDKYAEALNALGDVQTAVDLALQRYTIDQITSRIARLRERDQAYQAKYGMDYPSFAQRTAQDEAFVRQVETKTNPLWENDLADWEFCVKGIEDWTRTLQTILLT